MSNKQVQTKMIADKHTVIQQLKQHLIVAEDNLCATMSAFFHLSETESPLIYAIQKARMAALNAEYNSLCESYNNLSRSQTSPKKDDPTNGWTAF